MVYEPGQVRTIFQYINNEIGLFILGGPADGSEAQEFHEAFPHIPIVGFEPNRDYHQYQLVAGFPGKLFDKALSDKVETRNFYMMGEGAGRSSRLEPENPADYQSYPVQCTTLDKELASSQFQGRAALWIDIERSELLALRGATKLLEQNRIGLIYLEAYEETIGPITEFLKPYDFVEFERVNQHERTEDSGVIRYNRFDAIFRWIQRDFSLEEHVTHYKNILYYETDNGYIVWRDSSGHNVEILALATYIQRKGTGRELLQAVLNRLSQRTDKSFRVFGYVRSNDARALAFYSAMGFELVSVGDFYADGPCTIFWQRFEVLMKTVFKQEQT